MSDIRVARDAIARSWRKRGFSCGLLPRLARVADDLAAPAHAAAGSAR